MRSISAAIVLAVGLLLPSTATAGLIDQRGAAFSFDPGRGPYVVTFIATRCTDACPIANAVFSAALAAAAKGRVRATFVTATLDPAYDTPFVMAEYAQRVGADPSHWRFISGKQADVAALMRRFGVASDAREHSSFIYILAGGHPVRALLLSNGAPERIVDLLKKA